MKILITGGTGLIGSALTRSLLNNDYQITVISRTPDLVDPRCEAIPWDLDLITQEIKSSKAVINLAGASISGSNPLSMRWTEKRKSLIASSRIQAGDLLLQAIQRSTHKPEIIIQASAIGYYGNQGSQPVDENSPPGKDFLADVCQTWENSTAGVEELGIRRIVTRLGLVLSGEGGLLPLLALPFKFYFGGPIGNGLQQMSWIHVDDVVHSILHFMNNPSTQGIFNLTAPVPIQNLTFSEALGKSLNRPSWLPIPPWALKIILGEASTLAVDGREVIPFRLLESGYKFNFKEIDPALKDLFQKINNKENVLE